MLENAARAIQGALCGAVRETFHWIDSTLVAIRQSEKFPLIVLLRVLSDAITRVSDVSMSISIVNFFLSKDSFDTGLLTPNMKRARKWVAPALELCKLELQEARLAASKPERTRQS